MDLNTITEVVRRPPDRPGAHWRDGDAWLAGGTWLFSGATARAAPSDRSHDAAAGTPSCRARPASRSAPRALSASCMRWRRRTIGERAPLFATSCEAFLASFKVWNSATVGGNICMSLPAGPMITMTVALEATYTLWATDGSERTVDAADFVTGNHQNILAPGRDPAAYRHPDAAPCASGTRHRRFTLTQPGSLDDVHDRLRNPPGHERPAAHRHRGHHTAGADGFRHHAGRRDAPAEHRRDTRGRVVRRSRTAPRTTAATWRSTSPKRSGSSSAQEGWA